MDTHSHNPRRFLISYEGKLVPMINVCYNFITVSLSMCVHKICIDPQDKVVLECPFDNLMEQIWCQKLMNVSSRKAMCEWLKHFSLECKIKMTTKATYNNISTNSKISPYHPRIPGTNVKISFIMSPLAWVWAIKMIRRCITSAKNWDVYYTLDTILVRCQPARPVLDNQQYMVQGHIPLYESGHLGTWWLQAGSSQP